MSYPLVSEGQPLMVVQDSCDKDGRGPLRGSRPEGQGLSGTLKGLGRGRWVRGPITEWTQLGVTGCQLIYSSSSSPKHLQLAGLKEDETLQGAYMCSERNASVLLDVLADVQKGHGSLRGISNMERSSGQRADLPVALPLPLVVSVLLVDAQANK
ncbi:hypothetical protein NEUTE2DRAFT_134987 [Neurospora tetrasperma FGSC 2509]|nr:hypothetical protein NEUTE2DRAFT_134987 [Neurospora tetrasperma FGSC 2509]